jgi:TM2 domain-containing membrane protein YozV
VTRGRRPPRGRRAEVIAVLLSLLVAGLGHIYIGRLARALLWFAGLILISVVISQGDSSLAISAGIGAAMSIAAALDALILLRIE